MGKRSKYKFMREMTSMTLVHPSRRNSTTVGDLMDVWWTKRSSSSSSSGEMNSKPLYALNHFTVSLVEGAEVEG